MVSRDVTLTVADDSAGMRLDRLLASTVPGVGRRGATRLFALGRVRVDGRRARKSDIAQPGQQIVVVFPSDVDDEPPASAVLTVVLERADLVVVSKQGGLPTASRPGVPGSSLAGALLARYPEMRDVGFRPAEAGLVHRLDNGTSGLLVAARDAESFQRLSTALKAGAFDKRYLAIVTGAVPPDPAFTVSGALIPSRGRGRVRVSRDNDMSGPTPRTDFTHLSAHGRYTLLEASTPHAGRHQIRAHLASIGAPIAGDVLYGAEFEPTLGHRHALHCHSIEWPGDSACAGFSTRSPMPPEFGALLTPTTATPSPAAI